MIQFQLPHDLEEQLRRESDDLDQFAKEALLVEFYRQGTIDHSEFANALGLSRYEADGILKRHGVMLNLSTEQLLADVEDLRRLTGR